MAVSQTLFKWKFTDFTGFSHQVWMADSWRFETCLAGKPPFSDAEDTQIYSRSGFIVPVPTAILEKIKYIHCGVCKVPTSCYIVLVIVACPTVSFDGFVWTSGAPKLHGQSPFFTFKMAIDDPVPSCSIQELKTLSIPSGDTFDLREVTRLAPGLAPPYFL